MHAAFRETNPAVFIRWRAPPGTAASCDVSSHYFLTANRQGAFAWVASHAAVFPTFPRSGVQWIECVIAALIFWCPGAAVDIADRKKRA